VIKKLFNKKKKIDPNKPDRGYAYGVSTGKYLGEFFVFMEVNKKDDLIFLSLPKMIKRVVPKHKFIFAITNKILEFEEVLPKKVMELCTAQFKSIK